MQRVERTAPVRPVTDEEVEAFWRDGVVCLRGILPLDVVAAMAEPVERALAHQATDLSEMGDALAAAGAEAAVDDAVTASGTGRGRFRAGTDHWVDDADFRDFALRSPLGELVATLLRSERVRLYEDSVLVKEPGTRERTAFHQDMAYFHLDGEQVCTTWVPLDPVTEETGAVRFVVGSHLDRTAYRPNLFVTTMALPGTEGHDVPDHFATSGGGGGRIVSFDTVPGDVTVHHARTIHGAPGNASASRRRRAISVRYAGDDVTFRPRPGSPGKPHHAGLVEGTPLDDERFPPAWP
jgi:ectoine hydroxylase-related dioxygenase (phytanoyl-CoA dioxygenase family)